VEVIENLPSFQAGDDGQEDPRELEEKRTWRRSKSRKQAAVDMHIDFAQKAVGKAYRQQDTEKELWLIFSIG